MYVPFVHRTSIVSVLALMETMLYLLHRYFTLPPEETCCSLPPEETGYSLPLEETSRSLHPEETICFLPHEKTSCSLPLEDTSCFLPLEETYCSLPLEETCCSLPPEETSYFLHPEETADDEDRRFMRSGNFNLIKLMNKSTNFYMFEAWLLQTWLLTALIMKHRTCARNENYDEALDLEAYVSKLPIMYPKVNAGSLFNVSLLATTEIYNVMRVFIAGYVWWLVFETSLITTSVEQWMKKLEESDNKRIRFVKETIVLELSILVINEDTEMSKECIRRNKESIQINGIDEHKLANGVEEMKSKVKELESKLNEVQVGGSQQYKVERKLDKGGFYHVFVGHLVCGGIDPVRPCRKGCSYGPPYKIQVDRGNDNQIKDLHEKVMPMLD
uniref:Uncharacterized protein n=1 Tax=Tanacetum cinerariifolium TaxID=118510 RepID=A0A699GLM3_TANCI|nr:hypothetical protein [Tanacetum cinerariifolium]